MALRLAEVEPRDYEFICTPTGNELPQMLAHWAKLEVLLGKPLVRLSGGHNLLSLSSEKCGCCRTSAPVGVLAC